VPNSVDILRVRKELGRDHWHPAQPIAGGWHLTTRNLTRRVIVLSADHDGVTYVHASIAGFDELPTPEELGRLHQAVFGDGFAYQVFAPAEHNLAIPFGLHLLGRLDGAAVLPDFKSLPLPVAQ
jgi:hypothetical protein